MTAGRAVAGEQTEF